MAYFNNAFNKTFVVASADLAAGTSTSALAAGEIGLVDGADWQTVAVAGGGAVPAITAGELAYGVIVLRHRSLLSIHWLEEWGLLAFLKLQRWRLCSSS